MDLEHFFGSKMSPFMCYSTRRLMFSTLYEKSVSGLSVWALQEVEMAEKTHREGGKQGPSKAFSGVAWDAPPFVALTLPGRISMLKRQPQLLILVFDYIHCHC